MKSNTPTKHSGLTASNLYTNFGQTRFYGDQYLGDPMLAPIYEELNRRNALIYVHPKDNLCCREVVPGVDGSTIEYGTDTTRTIVSLLTSGTAARYPNISFIFAHGGGTAPYLIGRIAGAEAAYLQEGGVVRQGAAAARTSEAMPRGHRFPRCESFTTTPQAWRIHWHWEHSESSYP